jgi:thioesterase DpgC
MQNAIPPAAVDVLTDALPEDEVHEWLADEPAEASDLIADRERYRAFWQGAERLIDMMPEKSARPAAQEQAAEAIWARVRESRDRFLRAHARAVYGAVTHRMARFVRVEELLFAAADAFPGLVPKRAQIAAEKDMLQRDKDGLEIDRAF